MMVNTLYHGFTWIGSEWVMWVLMILSVGSVAIIIERFKSITSQEKTGEKLWVKYVSSWMDSPEAAETKNQIGKNASAMTSEFKCVEAALVELIAKNKNASREDIEKITQSFLGKKKIELERYLAFLGTVGANAPFIGLFGTVLGIIRAFKELGENNAAGGIQTVSSGLAEALVATAVGLMVAIPAVVFFNYFQRKIKTVIARAESLGGFLMTVKF